MEEAESEEFRVKSETGLIPWNWKLWVWSLKLCKEEVIKSVWGMPRLSEAKKDVISCEKLRGSANRN